MKFVALFALVAFAFVAQANAKSVYDLSVDRGQIADALRAKLEAGKAKLSNLVDSASVKLKKTIAKLQKKTDEVIDQLKEKVHGAADKVFEAAQNLIAKIEKFEDKYLAFEKSKPNTKESAAAEEALESVVESQ